MSAATALDLPPVPNRRRIRLTVDLPSASWEVPVTMDLEGRRDTPAVVVRAPRRMPEPEAPLTRPEPCPAPLARIALVPRAAAPAARPEPNPVAPRPAPPRPAPATSPRYEESLPSRLFFGGFQALVGFTATSWALVEYAEISIVNIFGGAFGGAAISLAVAMFLSLLLLAINVAVNLVALRLTQKPMMLIGTLLAVPLSIGLFDTVQDGLTVFGYYIQGGRGVHPTVLQYQNPRAFRSTGL